MIEDVCANCKHWVRVEVRDGSLGICRGGLPLVGPIRGVVSVESVAEATYWPVTCEAHMCGHHRRSLDRDGDVFFSQTNNGYCFAMRRIAYGPFETEDAARAAYSQRCREMTRKDLNS